MMILCWYNTDDVIYYKIMMYARRKHSVCWPVAVRGKGRWEVRFAQILPHTFSKGCCKGGWSPWGQQYWAHCQCAAWNSLEVAPTGAPSSHLMGCSLSRSFQWLKEETANTLPSHTNTDCILVGLGCPMAYCIHFWGQPGCYPMRTAGPWWLQALWWDKKGLFVLWGGWKLSKLSF